MRSFLMAPAGDAGGGDWRASLPEAIRSDPSLADFKDVASLAQSLVETKRLVGSSIRPPGPDASPEDRKSYLERVLKTAPELALAPEPGSVAPKDAKEYVPPAGLELPEAALAELRREALEEGLTRKQFEARAKKELVKVEAAKQRDLGLAKALKAELGDAYGDRLQSAAAAAERLGFPPALVADVKLGRVDLATYNALAKAAAGFGEPREGAMQQGGNGTGRLTPGEAKLQAAEIRGNPDYFDDRTNPALHQQLVRRHMELMKAAYPDG